MQYGEDVSPATFVAAKSDFALDGLLRLMQDSDQIKILACVEPSEKCWHVLHKKPPTCC